MTLFNRLAFEKELDIINIKMEYAIQDILNISEVTVFQESADNPKFFDKVKAGIKKIIDTFKTYINKIKEKVSKKMEEISMRLKTLKIQHQMSKIIKGSVKITDFAEEKKLERIAIKIVSNTRKSCNAIIRKPEKSENILAKFKKDMDAINDEIDNCKGIISVKLSEDSLKADQMSQKLNKMSDMIDQCFLDISSSYGEEFYDMMLSTINPDSVEDNEAYNDNTSKEEISKEEEREIKEAGTIIQKIQAKAVSALKKIVDLLSRNKVKVAAAVASVGAVGIGGHKLKKHYGGK